MYYIILESSRHKWFFSPSENEFHSWIPHDALMSFEAAEKLVPYIQPRFVIKLKIVSVN